MAKVIRWEMLKMNRSDVQWMLTYHIIKNTIATDDQAHKQTYTNMISYRKPGFAFLQGQRLRLLKEKVLSILSKVIKNWLKIKNIKFIAHVSNFYWTGTKAVPCTKPNQLCDLKINKISYCWNGNQCKIIIITIKDYS